MNKNLTFKILSLTWGYLTWYLTTTPNLVVAPDNLLNTIVMMGGHFVFFGIQAVLLKLIALPTAYCALITSVYGLLIELVQLNIPGRSGDPLDWLLDTLGAVVFIYLFKKFGFNI